MNRPDSGTEVRLFFSADAAKLGLVDTQAEEDGEGEADDPGNLRQRQLIDERDVLGNKQIENEHEDGHDLSEAEQHGSP